MSRYLASLNRSVNTGRKARALMIRNGCNMNGDRLWSAEEDALLRAYPRQYDRILALMPGRTRGAIARRSFKLGLTKPLRYWTKPKLAVLRKLYPRSDQSELLAAFPEFTIGEIRSTVCRYGLPGRKRKPYPSTGIAEIDEIRQTCFEIGWTMVDLDDMAGTGDYFTRSRWTELKSINRKKVALAQRALAE